MPSFAYGPALGPWSLTGLLPIADGTLVDLGSPLKARPVFSEGQPIQAHELSCLGGQRVQVCEGGFALQRGGDAIIGPVHGSVGLYHFAGAGNSLRKPSCH